MLRQCVVIAAPRRIEVVDEALPPGRPGQLLVRTEVSAISAGTEMLFYRGQVPAAMSVDATIGALGQSEVQYPLRYGYSCVGHVIEVANGAQGAAHTEWLHRRVFAFAPHAWVGPLGCLLLLGAFVSPYRFLLPLGALVGLAVMTGAVSFHLFTPLGTDPNKDGGGLFKAACLVWMLCLSLLFLNFDDVALLSQRMGAFVAPA